MSSTKNKSFVWIVLLVLLSCFNVEIIDARSPVFERSYGSWAAEKVPEQLSKLNAAIQPFLSSEFVPSKDPRCKDLREQVEYARNMVDIFAYAYPKGSGRGNDQWRKTRKQLNRLHKSTGHYKDMDKDTGETEMRQQYDQVKNQLNEYYTDISSPDTKAFFSHPSKDQYQYRKRAKLSQMIWGEQPTGLPTLDYTGLGNIEMILEGIVKSVISNWMRVKDYTPKDFLADEKNLDTYHYVRKKLRIVDFIYQEFSLLLFKDIATSNRIMNETVRPFNKEIGKVKSDYEKYWKAHKKGKTEKAQHFQDKGEKDLKALNDKFKQQGVEQGIITNLRNLDSNMYPIDDFYNKEKTNQDTWFYIFVIFICLLSLVAISAAASFYWTRMYHNYNGYQGMVEEY